MFNQAESKYQPTGPDDATLILNRFAKGSVSDWDREFYGGVIEIPQTPEQDTMLRARLRAKIAITQGPRYIRFDPELNARIDDLLMAAANEEEVEAIIGVYTIPRSLYDPVVLTLEEEQDLADLTGTPVLPLDPVGVEPPDTSY